MERRKWSKEHFSAVVWAYTQVFVPRVDRYAIQHPNGQGYRQKAEPLTVALAEAHVRGELTLGAYALDTQDQAQWICFDADTAAQFQQLITASQQLQNQGITTYLEQSRRGGHWWLFVTRMPGQAARRLGHHLMQALGLDANIELYPKQDRLTTGPGSLVRLPLGIHRKSQQRYPFIQANGQPLAPTLKTQMALLAQPERVPDTFVEALLAATPEVDTPPPSPRFEQLQAGQGETLSEILKSRITVLDFISQFMELDAQQRGYCPFHEDQVKSFQVNALDNYWHCYAGCGGGSIIDFWMKWRNHQGQDGSFTATVKDLRAMLW